MFLIIFYWTLILGSAKIRVLYPSNFEKLTLFFKARTNAHPLSASVIVCTSLKGCFLVVKRVESYLKRLGKDVWRSVEEGPHVPNLTPIATDGAQGRLGGGSAAINIPTNDDLDKMEKDAIAFYEISCGVAPGNFDIIINCKSAKEIWEVL